MVSPKLRKSAAILLGLVLAGMPAAAVHAWLGRYIEQQAINELDVTARRAIGLAEARLVMVTEALDGLAARGVRSCAGADLEAMHETSFRVVPIKELSVVEPAGDTRCTNLAIPLGERSVHRHDRESAQRHHDRDHPARRRSPTVWSVSAATRATDRGSPR